MSESSKKQKSVIVDIETAHIDPNSLSESQQEYLYREAEKIGDPELKEEKIQETTRMLSLFPFTAKVIVIGLFLVESEQRFVYFESEQDEEKVETEPGIFFKGLPEKQMLEEFWKFTDKTNQIITFNGRRFDIPFLMLRSAVLGIKARNYMGYRYDSSRHLDLLEQLTFFGGFRAFNLDFYCHAFGIESPKSKGVTGMEVQTLYEAGKIKEIASYCARDILATYHLYKKWEEYLKP